MTFGPYPAEACYKIEHSSGHLSLGENFKIVEFTYFEEVKLKLWFIEAKSTIPKDTVKYFDELFEKFENSLLLHAMGKLKRNQSVIDELPDQMASMNWQTVKFNLRLVIPEIPKEFLPQATDKLRQRLVKISKMWNFDLMDIKVINKDLARREGLIE
jgi:hypothetical protein